jgi:6-phosphogluconate dehydrogenase
MILIYVPHGEPTDQVIADLKSRLEKGEVLIDGGNTHWRDSIRHCQELRNADVKFLDVGTSGGVSGARHGACFMAGGDAEAFAQAEPLLSSLSVPDGVVHASPAGAGHFVKLIHNAIEFGMLQAIGEGVDLLSLRLRAGLAGFVP